jgi:hypothetical protein
MGRLFRDHNPPGPGLQVKTHRMGSEDNKALDFVKNRVGDSMTAYGGQNTIFRELNRQYLSMSPPIEARDNDRAIITGRRDDPEVFVPIIFAVIESAIPQFVFGQLGQRPHVEMQGRTQDDQNMAEAATQILDYDLERDEVLLQAYPFAKSMFKYGTGIGKVGYRYEYHEVKKRYRRKEPTGYDKFNQLLSKWTNWKEKEPVVDYDGPCFDWVSVFNFGVDPLYWRFNEMRYVWERRWSDRRTLQWEHDMYGKLTGEKLYKNLDRIPTIAKGFAEGVYQWDARDDTSELMGWTMQPGWKRQSYAQVRDIERDLDQAIELIEYWEDDRWVTIANGETIIHDSENPWDDKKKPYVMSQCIPLEGYPWGMGLIHPISKSQDELNAFRDLNLRQARLNATNVWAVPEDFDLPPEAAEVDPGDVVQVPFYQNGNPGLVPLLQGRPLPPESQIYEDRMLQDIQRAVAFSSLRMGGAGAGGIDTATEAKMMGASEQLRIQLYNLMGETTFLKQLATKFFARRQQFHDEEQIFRIIGKKGPEYKKFTLQEIAGQYDMVPLGSQTHVGKEVIRQQMLQGLSISGQNPILMQIANHYEMWLEFWKNMDGVRFPERFVIPPPAYTTSPETENIVLTRGEFFPVQPTDDHMQHTQVHYQGFQEVTNPRGMEALQEHLKQHQKFAPQKGTQAGGQRPPQEQPGMKGSNVPNPENATVESMGTIQARIGGQGHG